MLCPSCGLIAPAGSTRCRRCLGDLRGQPQRTATAAQALLEEAGWPAGAGSGSLRARVSRRLVLAATVLVLSLGIRPVETAALDYQRVLADGFRELSLIYGDYGAAMSAAGSPQEIADIEARTVTAVGRVIASLRDAREALPRTLRTALGMVSGCPPLT